MKYYELEYTDDAKDDIQHLKKSGDKVTLKKLETLLLELTEHPTTEQETRKLKTIFPANGLEG